MTIRRHNPALSSRIRSFLTANDATGLCGYLAQLSNANARTAGFMLSEELLPELTGDCFWHFFSTIVPTNSKAYLGTFLKAAVKLLGQNQLDVLDARLSDFTATATDIDRRKITDALLPQIGEADKARHVLTICYGTSPEACAPPLFRAGTPVACFLLFKQLQCLDADRELLRQFALMFMRRGDHRSFNMACILHQYFALDDLPGTFSLHLAPYELSRLDESYESFLKILLK